MKRNLLLVLLACLTATAVRADLIWYEGFNYADGDLTNVSSGLWLNASGGSQDMLVSGNQLQVSASASTVPRSSVRACTPINSVSATV